MVRGSRSFSNFFKKKEKKKYFCILDWEDFDIANQLTLDASEYSDMVKEQREMIKNFETELDQLREENRNLKNKVIFLESNKR